MGEQNELLAGYVHCLGEEYGAVYYHCLQEVWLLSYRWNQHETLFDRPEKVELLNRAAPDFWGTVQDAMYDAVLLGLCRLTDPPATRGSQNLSVNLLLKLEKGSKQLEMAELVSRANISAAFARSWRDKRIAHTDLAHRLALKSLQEATRLKVTQAIDEIYEVVLWVSLTNFDSDLRMTQVGDDGVQTLLKVLISGVSTREARREALRNGEISPSEYIGPSWTAPVRERSRYRWSI